MLAGHVFPGVICLGRMIGDRYAVGGNCGAPTKIVQGKFIHSGRHTLFNPPWGVIALHSDSKSVAEGFRLKNKQAARSVANLG